MRELSRVGEGEGIRRVRWWERDETGWVGERRLIDVARGGKGEDYGKSNEPREMIEISGTLAEKSSRFASVHAKICDLEFSILRSG